MSVLSSAPPSFTAGACVAQDARIANARRALRSIVTAIVLIASLPAQAAVFRVGSGPGCTHNSIQTAITAAENSAGADTIRITRSLFYIEQALVLTTSQEVDLVGGFETCAQAASDGVLTDVSGIGGALEPVMRITINSGGVVRLRHLTILRGDEDGTGHGGGIFFRGNGSLQISDSAITDNVAGYGGGIYAEGTGTDAELIIGANVVIANNTARYSGGGIYVDGMEMAMREQGSVILGNVAQGLSNSGFGGGLILLSRGNLLAGAYIGGGGFGTGTILGNTARYGGGVAVIVGDNADLGAIAKLQLFTTQSDRRAMIRQNTASEVGGGVYLKGKTFFGAMTNAEAVLWNADIVENQSPDGAAACIDEHSFLIMPLDTVSRPAGALPCPINNPCGRITGNQAQNAAQQPTSGAVIWNGRLFDINSQGTPSGGVLISGNRGGRLIDSNGGYQVLRNALIVNNDVSQQLFRAVNDGIYEIDSTTIAGNIIGAAQVFAVNDDFSLKSSIIWQPGKTTLSQTGGTRTLEWSIASEVGSLGGGLGAVVAAPRFIDPARGDYRLRAASPAVDYAIPEVGDDRDVHGLPRDQRIPEVFRSNPLRLRDAGAHERPALQPLVLNGDLDVDLNLWTPVTANAATWDNTQNAPGSTGGSVRVSLNNIPQSRIVAMTQCIHLPGPGLYELNGWGRSGIGTPAERDATILAWEYRNNGGEACNAGTPTMTGDHVLTTAASWGSPPASLINITQAQFTNLSSISVSLVVVDRGVTTPGSVLGWFDGITLGIAASDTIFANGFE